MKLINILSLAFAFLAIQACSSGQVFEGIQSGNRFKCAKESPQEHEECIERSSKGYNEYEKEREGTLENR